MKKKAKIKEKLILPNTRIIDLSLYFKKEKILVIADLHLGYEEAMNKEGIFIPRMNFDDCRKRMQKIFLELKEKEGIDKKNKLEKIIILGDLKHEFGGISEQEWNEVILMLEFLSLYCREIVLVQGNHDNILGPIAKWKNMEIVPHYYLKDKKILFLHGHKMKFSKEFIEAKILVIAHEHPAISLREGVKKEKYKCFLKGKYEKKELIVLPSILSITEGADVLNKKLLSPFLQGELDEFETWIVEDKIYYFGKIKNL